MGHNGDAYRIGLKDVLVLLHQAEVEHAVKIRLSVVPRPGSGYEQGCIFLATPYHTNNRKMATIAAEQHLWPSAGHKTEHGLWVYLIHRLLALLDEHEHQKAREEQMKEPERLTPLEQYIAGGF